MKMLEVALGLVMVASAFAWLVGVVIGMWGWGISDAMVKGVLTSIGLAVLFGIFRTLVSLLRWIGRSARQGAPLVASVASKATKTATGAVQELCGRNKPCPYCAESIKADALVCKHCRNTVAKRCGGCAEVVRVGARQCQHCGTTLQ
jgi:hypothetical protein